MIKKIIMTSPLRVKILFFFQTFLLTCAIFNLTVCSKYLPDELPLPMECSAYQTTSDYINELEWSAVWRKIKYADPLVVELQINVPEQNRGIITISMIDIPKSDIIEMDYDELHYFVHFLPDYGVHIIDIGLSAKCDHYKDDLSLRLNLSDPDLNKNITITPLAKSRIISQE